MKRTYLVRIIYFVQSLENAIAYVGVRIQAVVSSQCDMKMLYVLSA